MPFQAALIGLGFALFVITIIVNIIARAVIARGERVQRGDVMAADRRQHPRLHGFQGEKAAQPGDARRSSAPPSSSP